MQLLLKKIYTSIGHAIEQGRSAKSDLISWMEKMELKPRYEEKVIQGQAFYNKNKIDFYYAART